MVNAALAVDGGLPGAVAARCLHQLFEEQVARTPDAIAIVDANQRLTYAELERRSDELAEQLRRAGAGPEILIGICSERTVSMVAGMIAILKAGSAYVPLDPGYPAERLAAIAADAAFPILLTERRLLGRLPRTDARLLLLDDPPKGGSGARVLAPVPSAANLAYVLYTSGSTGQPKGVAIQHSSVVAFLEWVHRTFSPIELAAVLASTSICFDLSVFELFGPLTCGGRAVLVDNALALASVREEITLINTVPSAMTELLHSKAIPASVRTINLAGEPLRLELARALDDCGAQLGRVLNLYGPTEDTTYSTWAQVERGTDDAPSIGRPITGTQAHVLDDSGWSCADGEAGELYLGGEGLARGYLNRPEQTADRFVPDPFSRVPGQRLYRTGDRVRIKANGELQFLGRADHQVKVRGYRIELEEIQAALSAHAAVMDAVAIAPVDQAGATQLVAYIVPRAGSEPAVKDIRRFLENQLPSYMVPGRFVFLDELPRTPNGKVDRGRLPSPNQVRPQIGIPYVAPASALEAKLGACWSRLLRLDRIGMMDDVFGLGAHSLHAMRFVSEMRADYEIDFLIIDVFAHPTVRAMAEKVERAAHASPNARAAGTVDLEDSSDGDGAPLTAAQERFWFLDSLHPSNPAFNVPAVFRLSGPVDLRALRQAISAVVERHAPLRTSFLSGGGRVRQVVRSDLVMRGALVDLRLLIPATSRKEADRLIAEETTTPFDLSTGPLLRSLVIRMAEGEHILVLTMHHIATDGWSLALVADEISRVYRSLVTGMEATFPDLRMQYIDYARRQAAWQRTPQAAAQASYWQRQLNDVQFAELPTDHPRGEMQTFRPGRAMVRLGLRTMRQLNGLRRSEGVTRYMSLLAALALLLERHTGSDDITIGSPAVGRNHRDLESLVGLFINTLVVRVDLSGTPTFRALLQRVRRAALEAFANQDLSYEKVLEAVQPARLPGRNPLFQVLFNLYNFADAQLDLPGVAAETLEAPPPGSLFDLTIYAREREQRIELEMVYNADLFEAGRMSELLGQLATLISQVAADPDQPIDRYSLVTPTARRVLPNPSQPLFADWSPSAVDMFGKRAGEEPDRVALEDGSERWTRGDLEVRSNQCRAWLSEAGIGSGDLVAILTPRSPALVASVLGVWKAGAAIVVLESANPVQRLREQIGLINARALIACDASMAHALVDSTDRTIRLLLVPPDRRTAGVDPLSRYPASKAPLAHRPDATAYVAFTSGTTGTPRAIAASHRPLSHFIEWQVRRFALRSTDRFSMLSGLGHDPLLRDILTPLSVGATLCIPSSEQLGDPATLLSWLRGEAVTAAHLTPVLGRLLIAAAGANRVDTLSDLTHLFFGGDRLTRADIEGWQRLAPAATIVNFYGATETPQAMGCWIAPPAGSSRPLADTAPLGHGIDGVQLLVRNAGGAPCGIGERGEIAVRTPYLALGYLNDPELTAERFIANASSTEDRLYRTGDLGRYRMDGTVELCGRQDDQVKVRGFRVELGDVEATIRRHPAVADVAVSLDADQAGPRLVAHLVIQPGARLRLAGLRRWLRDRLPEYMWPGAIVRLDRLPTTANHKLDRKALPAAPAPSLDGSTPEAAPRGHLQQAIARVWAEVLQTSLPGADDNFFDIGGTSLTVIRVRAALKEALGRDVAIVDLFRYPNVRALARHLAGQDGPSSVSMARRRVRARMEARNRRLEAGAGASGGSTP